MTVELSPVRWGMPQRRASLRYPAKTGTNMVSALSSWTMKKPYGALVDAGAAWIIRQQELPCAFIGFWIMVFLKIGGLNQRAQSRSVIE